MRMADVYRPPSSTQDPGSGGGSSYVPDPGSQDPGGGPNRAQEAANARKAARIAALRANPMFRKSSTPITFPEGYNPQVMNSLISNMEQGQAYQAANPQMNAMFRPTRSY